jgi:tRNA nucleotidyltransferase (CCA-adding enzyme)
MRDYPQADIMRFALRAAQGVDAGAVASQHTAPEAIRDAVYRARLAAVETALAQS